MHPETATPFDYAPEPELIYYPAGSHLSADADDLHAEMTVLMHELRETNLPEAAYRTKTEELITATEDLFRHLSAGGRFPGAWMPF